MNCEVHADLIPCVICVIGIGIRLWLCLQAHESWVLFITMMIINFGISMTFDV